MIRYSTLLKKGGVKVIYQDKYSRKAFKKVSNHSEHKYLITSPKNSGEINILRRSKLWILKVELL